MKLSSSIVLEATADAIRKINPDADIITEHYTKKSDGWWRSLMSLPSRRVEAEESDEDKISFSQLTLNNAHLNNPGELIALLEDYLHGDLALCLMKRKSHSPGRM